MYCIFWVTTLVKVSRNPTRVLTTVYSTTTVTVLTRLCHFYPISPLNCSCCEMTCGCAEIHHMSVHVGVHRQVPGSLFSRFNNSSEFGMRHTGLCIGFLINKTWDALIQIKEILISSSVPPPHVLWLNVRTKNWGSSVAEKCGWGGAGRRGRRWREGGQRWRSPGRKPLMLEQHVRLAQQHQLK